MDAIRKDSRIKNASCFQQDAFFIYYDRASEFLRDIFCARLNTKENYFFDLSLGLISHQRRSRVSRSKNTTSGTVNK